jgi:hypothetical protein
VCENTYFRYLVGTESHLGPEFVQRYCPVVLTLNFDLIFSISFSPLFFTSKVDGPVQGRE